MPELQNIVPAINFLSYAHVVYIGFLKQFICEVKVQEKL